MFGRPPAMFASDRHTHTRTCFRDRLKYFHRSLRVFLCSPHMPPVNVDEIVTASVCLAGCLVDPTQVNTQRYDGSVVVHLGLPKQASSELTVGVEIRTYAQCVDSNVPSNVEKLVSRE